MRLTHYAPANGWHVFRRHDWLAEERPMQSERSIFHLEMGGDCSSPATFSNWQLWSREPMWRRMTSREFALAFCTVDSQDNNLSRDPTDICNRRCRSKTSPFCAREKLLLEGLSSPKKRDSVRKNQSPQGPTGKFGGQSYVFTGTTTVSYNNNP